MPDITAKSWSRFNTTNFCVTAEIMGASHEFNFENNRVSIRLPKAEDADRDKRYDQVAHVYSSRADTKEPLAFLIKKIDIEIEIPELLSVPDEALSKPAKQFKYFSEEQQKTADNI